MGTIVLIVVSLFRALLAVVLIASGAAKLTDLQNFSKTITSLEIKVIPKQLVGFITLLIPLIEIVLGFGFIIHFFQIFVGWITTLLFIVFSFINILVISKNKSVSCRCFGALSDSQFSIKSLIRCLIFTSMALIVTVALYAEKPQLLEDSFLDMLAIAGYSILALAFAQAARVTASYKERSQL